MNKRIKTISSVIIIIIVASYIVIGLMYQEIFQLPYEKILEPENDSAIIYVWGHAYFLGSEYFQESGFSKQEINSIEKQCALSVFDRVKMLREKWKWDLYIFYGVEPKFERYHYKNLMIIFSGHGTYKDNHQLFMINRMNTLLVKNIGKSICCDNLTLIVDSCFSLNWKYDFTHENLTGVYTSDLCNSTTASSPYPKNSTNVQYFASFDYIFITNLYNGERYDIANRTTFDIYYAMYPQINCSI